MDLNDKSERKLLKKRFHEGFLHEERVRRALLRLVECSYKSMGIGNGTEESFNLASRLLEADKQIIEAAAVSKKSSMDTGKNSAYRLGVSIENGIVRIGSLGRKDPFFFLIAKLSACTEKYKYMERQIILY
ncbi:hypothetical protein M1373_02240 [Candidatus Marsarchaeota archaeon]|nr:hypothetical protein [Candidatus Marsarchaeota archaeon]MCL5404838.1 hypothetical protein [Candidatus Marsarchaeota archaeon]